MAIVDERGRIVDVSGVTTKQILLRKPDATVLTKTAAFDTTGTDGKIKYVTLSTDLDTAGSWSIQGYIELGSSKWHTDDTQFTVKANLS